MQQHIIQWPTPPLELCYLLIKVYVWYHYHCWPDLYSWMDKLWFSLLFQTIPMEVLSCRSLLFYRSTWTLSNLTIPSLTSLEGFLLHCKVFFPVKHIIPILEGFIFFLHFPVSTRTPFDCEPCQQSWHLQIKWSLVNSSPYKLVSLDLAMLHLVYSKVCFRMFIFFPSLVASTGTFFSIFEGFYFSPSPLNYHW